MSKFLWSRIICITWKNRRLGPIFLRIFNFYAQKLQTLTFLEYLKVKDQEGHLQVSETNLKTLS